jgi:hypothetical protein
VAEADPALLIADDDQRGEAEAPAALHHLGDAVDVDELVDELAVALFVSPLAGFTCHICFHPLSIQLVRVGDSNHQKFSPPSRAASGERLDAAVIEVAAAVEHHVLDALFLGALGDELADRLGRIDAGAGLLAALARRLLERETPTRA